MKTIVVFFLIFFSSFVHSQNLVPNSGFEDYVAPPCCSWMGTQADMDAAMQDWYIVSGSPDIFNTLAPISCFANCFSTDFYSFGHQAPHSGDFMAGIITYGGGMGAYSQYRESYEIRLTTPLTVGQKYYAEMYVSLADYSAFATNNISLYFSVPQVMFDITNTGPLYFTPQINEPGIVYDTDNWVKVSGTFIADSPAEYLLIANFTDDSLTNAFSTNQGWQHQNAYYFIDDILVRGTCLAISSSKTICRDDATVLTASSDSFNGWALAEDPATIISTDSVFVVSPTTTTTYLAFSDCDTFSVTVYVTDCTSQVEIEMPNIVTPNGDQANDLLIPAKSAGIVAMKTTLFNRWGQTIFETTDPTIQWDGSSYEEGVYYWKIEYEDFNSKKNEQHGFFQLVK